MVATHRVGFTAGSRYQGGEGEGKATFIFSDGEQYEGSWKDNRFSGHGKVRFSKAGGDLFSDCSYEGEWTAKLEDEARRKAGLQEGVKALQHGKGKMTWASGSVYEGEWKEGLQHGQGVYSLRSAAGDINVYEGEWEEGKKHGRGKYTIVKRNAVLEQYDGEWKENRRHGKGMCSYGGPINSNRKVAGVKADLLIGIGKGDLEVGTYSEGYRVGEGVRWSKDRTQAWKLQAGRELKDAKGNYLPPIELAEAAAFAEKMGFPDPAAAKEEEAETGDAQQLQQTKGFD